MQRVGFDTGAPSGVIAFTTVEGGESISRDGIFQSFSLNLPAGRSGTAGMMSDEPHANGSLGTENRRRRRIDIFGSSTIWSAPTREVGE